MIRPNPKTYNTTYIKITMPEFEQKVIKLATRDWPKDGRTIFHPIIEPSPPMPDDVGITMFIFESDNEAIATARMIEITKWCYETKLSGWRVAVEQKSRYGWSLQYNSNPFQVVVSFVKPKHAVLCKLAWANI